MYFRVIPIKLNTDLGGVSTEYLVLLVFDFDIKTMCRCRTRHNLQGVFGQAHFHINGKFITPV